MSAAARSCLALLAFVVAVHFPAMVNDGHYWDGWPLTILMDNGDWPALHELWHETGQPLGYVLYAALWHATPDFTAAYRLTIGACMLTLAFSVMGLCRKVLRLPVTESWMVAAFTASWPFYNVFVSEAFLHYVLSLALFYAAWRLYFLGLEKSRVIYRCLALALFALTSYTINSLVVYHYAFVAMLFLYGAPHTPRAFLRRYWFLLLLPVLVFTAKNAFNPPSGIYADYNGLLIGDHGIGDAVALFIKYLIRNLCSLKLVTKAFGHAAAAVWPLAMAVPVCALALWVRARPDAQEPAPAAGRLAALGAMFVMAAIVPYAAVGKYVYGGWGERHGMLMPFGLALLLAALSPRLKRRAAGALWLCLLSVNAATLAHQYVLWQARSVVDKAVIESLRALPAPKGGTAILYRQPENYIIDSYRPYEVSSLLHAAWGKDRWFAIATEESDMPLSRALSYYNANDQGAFRKQVDIISHFTPNGCIARITATLKDPSLTPWQAVRRYYAAALFSAEGSAPFLHRLVAVTITPTDPQKYSRCEDRK